jgi:glutamate carboxypeptidase
MDHTDLPFDAEAMLEGLKAWVETESPTWDRDAVNRMMDVASRDLVLMNAQVTRIPGRMGLGDCVLADLPHARRGEPGILVMIHLDTVHPVGTLAKLPWRREGDRCFGPGVLDMKGGGYIAFEALRQLQMAGFTTPLPVSVLLTSDEEIGSPSTRDVIEATARRHRYVLVPEPAWRNGALTLGRYAIARFNLKTVGRPSHAGVEVATGRSALHEMCRQVVEVEKMTSDRITYRVGVLHCGQWVNCVPSLCTAEALSMAKRQSDLDEGVERMLGLRAEDEQVQLEVTRGVTRPVWEASDADRELFGLAKALANGLGFDVEGIPSGGGSDGNFTGALGITTLDGLGVQGDGPHTLGEHLLVSSLVPRGRLVAGLLASLQP